jgi:hypothetical protein
MEIGSIYKTKDNHKIEIMNVIEDCDVGTAEIKTFVHRNSENCKSYGWAHNEKWFLGWIRIKDLERKLKVDGYKEQD